MGCTRDVINIRLQNKDYVEKFIDVFNEILEDYLYNKYCKIDKNHMAKEDAYGRYLMFIEEEPMFKMAEDGAQVDYFVKEYIKRYPEVDFWLSYDCEYTDCDGAMSFEYTYNSKNKELTIRKIYGDNASLSFCPECEEYFDEPLAYLEDYDKNETYYCPECGEEIFFDAEETTKIISLKEILEE